MVLLKSGAPPGPMLCGRILGSQSTNMAFRDQQPRVGQGGGWGGGALQVLEKVGLESLVRGPGRFPQRVSAIISASPQNTELFREKDYTYLSL